MQIHLYRAVTQLIAVLVIGSAACGQWVDMPNADRKAIQAFEGLVKSYRTRPALQVKAKLKVELAQGEQTATAREVEAVMLYSKGGFGRVELEGFTILINPPSINIVHESTVEDQFYTVEVDDGDSPFFPLVTQAFGAFERIPFPHVALLWGDADMSWTASQLYYDTSLIEPRSVVSETIEGKKVSVLTFADDTATMRIEYDPRTKLISRIQHTMTGGPLVAEGATRTNTYTYEYETFDKPADPFKFAFDKQDRLRSGVLAGLIKLPPRELAEQPAMPVAGRGALVGQPAPNFVLSTLDGGAIDLDDLKGHVVVLDFWATWCPPCRAALPKLHDVDQWARDEELPVTVLTINTMESHEPDQINAAVRQFWTAQRFTLPVAMDYSSQTAAAYGVNGIPSTIVIRSDGVVHAQHSGFGGGYEQQLKTDIEQALAALEGMPGDEQD